MVNIRDPPVEYHGILVSIVPDEDRPFYLTGDAPLFKLRVHNPGKERRYGRLFITWRLVNVLTIRDVKIDLEPGETEEYPLPREWLYTEGMAIYELRVMGPPEHYPAQRSVSSEEIVKAPIHPLCSYWVCDKARYEYEEEFRGWTKNLVRLTRVLVGLTAALIFLTLLQIFRTLN